MTTIAVKLHVVGALVIALAGTAYADGPQPGQEVTDLKPFAGVWDCRGKTHDGKAFTARLSVLAPGELNGFWYEMKYSRDKTKDAPAFAGHGILGFDTAHGKYYFTGADSFGGWAVLVGALSNKVLDLSGQANTAGQVGPFKFKIDASGKPGTLVFTSGPNLEDENTCRR